ncbi:chloramphenicol phosphotransferase [bacterium SCGC AG-212-C10]|nr:chloramphenicol phosphotransferase [bacterium SCGC AG-212-C10]
MNASSPGQIVVLNGPPRSGKSSIAAAIQATFDGVWMNLGVDNFMDGTPARFMPGIGLRPGGERPDLEPLVAQLYAALYESIAAHSRLGVNVVVDICHHDSYSQPRGILRNCALRLDGLPAWLVGVHCPIQFIMERRIASGWNRDYVPGAPIPVEVERWQREVHRPGIYDLELDTSQMTPEEGAGTIGALIASGIGPAAFSRLAAGEDFAQAGGDSS